MTADWPAFDRLLAALGPVPSRTGSVISTIYGDAVLPRGGSLALADLLVLMRRLGASDGVVRTAVSRLAADGVLVGRRRGRRSAYALTERSRVEFAAAVPAIYGALDAADAPLHLVLPVEAAERAGLEQAGYAAVLPGVMAGFVAVAGSVAVAGPLAAERALAARAWPQAALGDELGALAEQFGLLAGGEAPGPLEAMAARIVVIHSYRRMALRVARIPARLRGDGWAGDACRAACLGLYETLVPLSERWLDGCSDGSGPLVRGPDPVLRFSGGDTRPWGPASSPGR